MLRNNERVQLVGHITPEMRPCQLDPRTLLFSSFLFFPFLLLFLSLIDLLSNTFGFRKQNLFWLILSHYLYIFWSVKMAEVQAETVEPIRS